MRVDAALLIRATGCTHEAASRFALPLATTCSRFRIHTPKRLAAFIAQAGYESGDFHGSHGIFDAVWHGDHARVRNRLRYALPHLAIPDFEVQPSSLREPIWASLAAGDMWVDKDCNNLADKGNFTEITRRIAGGSWGEADRLVRLWMAQIALAARVAPEALGVQGFMSPYLTPSEAARAAPEAAQLAREVTDRAKVEEKKEKAAILDRIKNLFA